MFGVGAQEAVVIVLLLLIVFGPGKVVGMARDLVRFVNGARRTVEEFKGELLSEEVTEARRSVEEVKDEARRAVEGRG